MRILHTADWHLGKYFEGTDFSLIDEQARVLERLLDIAEQEGADVVVVAGDIFDTYNPSASARRLFYETVCQLSDSGKLVIAIAGNHDSPDMLTAEVPLYIGKNIIVMGSPLDDLTVFAGRGGKFELAIDGRFVRVSDGNESIVFHLLPYASEVRLREVFSADDVEGRAAEYRDKIARLLSAPNPFGGKLIGVSHLFMEGGEESGSERQLMIGSAYRISAGTVPESFDFFLLGHLHSYQLLSPRIVYSGSIFPLSASEARRSPAKFVAIVDTAESLITPLEILPADRVKVLTFNSIDEAIRDAENHKNSLVFLEVTASDLTPNQISRLKQAYAHNLITVRFSLPVGERMRDEVDIKSMSHAEIFREFYREKYGEPPSDELVTLFLKMLDNAQQELEKTSEKP